VEKPDLNRRNNEALADIVMWTRASLFHRFTDTNVPLKYEKLATKYPWIYVYLYSVRRSSLKEDRGTSDRRGKFGDVWTCGFYARRYAKRGICRRRRVCVCVSGFLTPKFTAKFERDHPLYGRQMQVGWVKIGHFRRKTRYNSKTVQDRCIVSIKVE